MAQINYTLQQQKDWHNNLPSKRVAASVFLQNSEGKYLAVKPNYRDYWNIPGGVVDGGESPLTAAVREVREEIGLDLDSKDLKLVAVSYRPAQDGFQDAIIFYFDGGTLNDRQISSMVLQESEIEASKFVTEPELSKICNTLKNKDIVAYSANQHCFTFIDHSQDK
jgi:8-oxo-dGTP pyrophosphatase MutT (NUDIX family)